MIRSSRHRVARLAAIVLAAGLVTAIATPAASADFHIVDFSGGVFAQDGTSFSQAAGHPYAATTRIEFPAAGQFEPDGAAKDIRVDLPPGFIANPEVIPGECTPAQLVNTPSQNPECPVSSQVGTAKVFVAIAEGVSTNGGLFFGDTGVYKMQAPPGTPALFAFNAGCCIPVYLRPSVRTGGDYGLSVISPETNSTGGVTGAQITLWGVPADPSHDDDRGVLAGADTVNSHCANIGPPPFPGAAECSNPAGYRPKAFITNPSNCAAGPLSTRLTVNSWQDPATFFTAAFDEDTNGQPTAATGCEKVPFDPDIAVRSTVTRPDSPSGLDVELTMPTEALESPTALAQANLKRARVTLPEGMTISPSAADGLKACTDAQLGLQSADAASCPDAAKIGTVSLETPLLADPLEGSVYVRTQNSNDPASGEMFRIAIVIDSAERGIRIKLAGQVRANPVTGRLETTFDDNPQLPFSRLLVHFKGGPRAPLATPPSCGSKTLTAEFSPWSATDPSNPAAGELVSRSRLLGIDCPGADGFAPAFEAGSLIPLGGAFSPLVLNVDRPDGQQYLSGLTVAFPTGLLAKLKGFPLCEEGPAAAGTCPIESRVGTAIVGVGPGASPFHLRGSVSLTGPYRGAPYGLSVAVPAIAGPFDLGTVVVRQAIQVDPTDAHITVVSDPLPTIVGGVPVRLRSIEVNVDRPGFTLNPTSCATKSIRGRLLSEQGSLATESSVFRAGACRALPFKPKLALRLTGKGQTTAGRHPGLNARLSQAPGQANIKGVAVRLPLSLALDPGNANGLCEFAEGQKADPHCPASSIIGRAKAVTPLLGRPLSGNVYFVKGVRRDPRTGRLIRTLPTLLVPLRGEVAINLRATTSVRRGRLVNTFGTVPDAPVSRFDLKLRGGKGGILVVTRSICRRRQVATVLVDAHSGKHADSLNRIKAPCERRTHHR